MKYLTLFFFTALPLLAYPQKTNTDWQPQYEVDQMWSTFIYPNQVISSEVDIQNAILEHFDNEDIRLTHAFTKQAKAFTHYHYHITYKGKRLFRGKAHAVVDRDLRLRWVELNDFPTTLAQSQVFPNIELAINIKKEQGAARINSTELVYFPEGDLLVPALSVELYSPAELHKRLVYTSKGLVYEKDLHKYHCQHSHHLKKGPNDTTVSAYVFDPDPLTTAQTAYGGAYVDNGDSDVPELQAERKLRPVTLTYQGGIFLPENDHVIIMDLNSPNVAPVTRTDDQFLYNRSESGFEDMNIIYHITKQRLHIAFLGYPNLPNYQIQVDPHANNGQDNSFFDFGQGPPYQLLFGEGGIDDAEDADVILHELTHAVVYEASPSNSPVTERECIEEALGDYFAASYSRSINNFQQDKVYTWDGNSTWSGRQVSSSKLYNQVSFIGGNIYEHTDLFADALMHIYDNIGRGATDQLVLESIFCLSDLTTMPQFAGFMIQSDSALNNGANYSTILTAFQNRNITPQFVKPPDFSIIENEQNSVRFLNTQAFSEGGELRIISTQEITKLELTDATGRTVFTLRPNKKELELGSGELIPGVYLLKLTTDANKQLVHKLVKNTL